MEPQLTDEGRGRLRLMLGVWPMSGEGRAKVVIARRAAARAEVKTVYIFGSVEGECLETWFVGCKGMCLWRACWLNMVTMIENTAQHKYERSGAVPGDESALQGVYSLAIAGIQIAGIQIARVV